MRDRSRTRRAALALALALLLGGLPGCAASRAPYGWSDLPMNVGASVYGAWIDVDTCVGGALPSRSLGRDEFGYPIRPFRLGVCRNLAGELLAAARDTLWILGANRVYLVPLRKVATGRLTRFDAGGAGGISAWTALGCVSTVSNGYYLVLTLPFWIVAGVVASNSRTHEAELPLPGTPLPRLSSWARYPQGLPPGLDPNRVPPKPKDATLRRTFYAPRTIRP